MGKANCRRHGPVSREDLKTAHEGESKFAKPGRIPGHDAYCMHRGEMPLDRTRCVTVIKVDGTSHRFSGGHAPGHKISILIVCHVAVCNPSAGVGCLKPPTTKPLSLAF